MLGLKLGHDIPVLAGIDLNAEPVREPLDAAPPPSPRRLVPVEASHQVKKAAG